MVHGGECGGDELSVNGDGRHRIVPRDQKRAVSVCHANHAKLSVFSRATKAKARARARHE